MQDIPPDMGIPSHPAWPTYQYYVIAIIHIITVWVESISLNYIIPKSVALLYPVENKFELLFGGYFIYVPISEYMYMQIMLFKVISAQMSTKGLDPSWEKILLSSKEYSVTLGLISSITSMFMFNVVWILMF